MLMLSAPIQLQLNRKISAAGARRCRRHEGEGAPALEGAAKGARLRLACLECGRIEEYSCQFSDSLKAELSRRRGFRLRTIRLEVGGRCSKCRAGPESEDCWNKGVSTPETTGIE